MSEVVQMSDGKKEGAKEEDTLLERSLEVLGKITDFHLPAFEVHGSDERSIAARLRGASCWSGRAGVSPVEEGTPVYDWLVRLLHQMDTEGTAIDFNLQHEGIRFRAHKQKTMSGWMLVLRRIAEEVPSIAEINMPAAWKRLFMLEELRRGGLILFGAETGQGKTTTAAAILRSRLERYGGFCLTVEDPVEMFLTGEWGERGLCIQSPVVRGVPGASSFAEALAGAVRSFPATPGNMLFIGEIRDGETASQALTAAINGHLVLATIHASSPIDTLKRVAALAKQNMGEQDAHSLLSASLRMAVNQRLHWMADGSAVLKGQILVSSGLGCNVASVIESGKFQDLNQILSDTQRKLDMLSREKRLKELSLQLLT